MSDGQAHRKVRTLAQTSFKPSEHAQPEARTNPVGPFATPTYSTNTLGGWGGGIEGEKREHRDVAFTHPHGWKASNVSCICKMYMLFVYAFENAFSANFGISQRAKRAIGHVGFMHSDSK